MKNKQPALTLIHLVDMDSMRHRYGVRSAEAKAALQRLDGRVARLIRATKDAGTFADTNFVVLGDHYQINVQKMIHLNMLFAKQGWLSPVAGESTYRNNWWVTAKTCDGETYVYVRGDVDRGAVKQIIARAVPSWWKPSQAITLPTRSTGPRLWKRWIPLHWGCLTATGGFTATVPTKQITTQQRFLLGPILSRASPLRAPTWLMRGQPLPICSVCSTRYQPRGRQSKKLLGNEDQCEVYKATMAMDFL